MMRKTQRWTMGWQLKLGSLALLAACAAPDETGATADTGAPPEGFPSAHPYLANSAWPASHRVAWAQGSSPRPGLQNDDAEVQFVEVGLPSITLAFTPDGTELWGSNPLEVYRLKVADPPEVVASLPVGSADDLFSGAYTLLDRDGRFFTTSREEVNAYEADGPDGIAAVGTVALPDAADDETVRGMGLTYDGVVIAVSSAGRVVAIDRSDLTVRSEVALDGSVSNSIAIDEDGGIYIVTDAAMHRVQWTGSRLSTDPADGAWSAAYETGSDEAAGGRLGTGSGSTPSLMSVDGDELVVITDADPLMHLVLFWRDAIPDGWQAPAGTDPRTAARLPVTFGDPSATSSVSEQSVLVMGDGAVVVNNDYGDAEGLAPIFEGLAPPGVERFTWDPDTDTLSSVWALDDLSCPNGIPTASAATGLMYCMGKRGETWTIEAIDWATGEPRFHVETGTGLSYNSTYAATQVGPNGEIWSGTFGGLVRVKAN